MKKAVALTLIVTVLIWVFPRPTYASFSYSRSITIDHTKVGASDSTSFPVGIIGTYSYLAQTPTGKVQNANGYDVGFYTNSNCSTGKMDWETDTYKASNGQVVYWVNVATLSHTADTVFYMCYGDSSINTDQSNKTAVWDSDYFLVMHFGDGTTLGLTDSTSFHNDGTLTGIGTQVSAGTGQVSGAANFPGGPIGATGIEVADAASLSPTSAYTFEVWANQTDVSGAGQSILGKYNSALTAFNEYNWGWVSNATVLYGWNYNDPAAQYRGRHGPDSGATGSWDYYAYTWSGAGATTHHKIYKNTSQIDNGDFDGGNGGAFTDTSAPLLIGGYTGGTGNGINGLLDELRMSDIVRPADWETAVYNDMSDPVHFYTVGAETPFGATATNSGITFNGGTIFKGNTRIQ